VSYSFVHIASYITSANSYALVWLYNVGSIECLYCTLGKSSTWTWYSEILHTIRLYFQEWNHSVHCCGSCLTAFLFLVSGRTAFSACQKYVGRNNCRLLHWKCYIIPHAALAMPVAISPPSVVSVHSPPTKPLSCSDNTTGYHLVIETNIVGKKVRQLMITHIWFHFQLMFGALM